MSKHPHQQTIRDVNWLISKIRGWDKVDAGFGCTSLVSPHGDIVVTSRHPDRIEAEEINWHADEFWSVLFLDFPPGTRLTRVDGEMAYHLCMHETAGAGPKVCQPGFTAGQVVCLAWLAWRTAVNIQQEKPAIIAEGSDAVQ